MLLRYAADRDTQEGYLDLLAYHEAAVTGDFIDDPHVRAFYQLTGWYVQGIPRERGAFLPQNVVQQYVESFSN